MEIYKKSGTHIILNKHHILIDPLANHESDIILVSHAHSDHISLRVFDKLSQPVYLSRPSLEIINERSKRESKKENIQIIKSGDEINLNGIKIQIFDAGHCIGSLQFKISYNQQNIIYTGDFCIEPRMGMQKGVILRGKNSTLITDSTYSDKKYDFPSRMEIYRKMLKWIKSVFKIHNTAVLFARKLGTGQELTDLINKSTLNCDIYVHPSIYYHNLIHNNYYPLGNFIYRRNPFDSSLEDFTFSKTPISKRKKVYLLPIYLYNRKYLPKIRKKYKAEALAICTGWALTQHFSVQSFALSSHADHKNIQHYFTESGAKNIIYF
ncbi:MAG: MBL fold metallo-hydrolase [Candidatus Helarchaeota archaeon]|nr:MBL fold metallo-hydrolase [Candidatus Helarchaeota archaeon]